MNNASSLCVLSVIQAFTCSPGSASTRSCRFPRHLKIKSFHPCCTYVTAHFLSHGAGCYCFSLQFFFLFFPLLFPRPDVPCRVCTSVVTMHEGDSKRTRGVGRVKNECHFECTNAAVRELCVIERGERPENVDLTPVPQLFSFPIQRSLILRDSALSKHIRVMTHIPGTTCSAEAHFSMLRDMLRGQ